MNDSKQVSSKGSQERGDGAGSAWRRWLGRVRAGLAVQGTGRAASGAARWGRWAALVLLVMGIGAGWAMTRLAAPGPWRTSWGGAGSSSEQAPLLSGESGAPGTGSVALAPAVDHGREGLAQVEPGGQPASPGTASVPPSGTPAGAEVAGRFPGRLDWPADGMVVSTSGWRRNPQRGDWTYQPGLELAVKGGAAVRAAGNGVVASVTADTDGMAVVVEHGGGWSTSYGRLASVRVEPRQQVRAGQVLGVAARAPDAAVPAMATMGTAQAQPGGVVAVASPALLGRSTLVFEVRHNEESLDPLQVMPASSFRVEEFAPGAAPEEAPGR